MCFVVDPARGGKFWSLAFWFFTVNTKRLSALI